MLRSLWVALYFVAVGASPVTNDTDGSRIYNGQIADEGQFPYMVSLQKVLPNNPRYHACSIFLITEWTCLGAAHCLYDFNVLESADVMCGVVGSAYQDEKSECHPFDSVYPHEKFNDFAYKKGYDIAVFIFKAAIGLGDNVKTIKLAAPDLQIEGKPVTSLGWGYVTDKDRWGRHRLRFAHLEVGSSENILCQIAFELHKDQICVVGKGGSGACVGDSGSPAVLEEESAVACGVLSYGKGRCGPLPSVFTDIRVHHDWITKHAKGTPEFEN